jgi:hypothetical protein
MDLHNLHYIFSVCCDVISHVVVASNSRQFGNPEKGECLLFLNCPHASAMAII